MNLVRYVTANPKTIHKSYHSALVADGFPKEVQFGPTSRIVTSPKVVSNTMRYLPKSKLFYNKLSAPTKTSRFLGNGLLTADASDAKCQRVLLEGQFRARALSSFEKFMRDETNAVVDEVKHNTVVDIGDLCKDITINIVGKTLLGNAFSQESQSVLIDDVDTLNRHVVASLNPLYSSMHGFPFYNTFIESRTMRVRAVVEDALELHTKNGTPDSLISIIEASSTSHEEAVDNILTFFLAGYDTTASAVATLLHIVHLDTYECILKRLHNELACGETTYLDNVIKETLRLYPPSAGGFIRTYTNEYKEYFPSNWVGNTNIIVPVYSMHRHPDHWDYPEMFLPERWGDISDSDVAGVYMPFSTGPRSCIGQRFAMLEMKTMLQIILTKLRFCEISTQQNYELNPVFHNTHRITAIAEHRVL